jgi:hypothetical protein
MDPDSNLGTDGGLSMSSFLTAAKRVCAGLFFLAILSSPAMANHESCALQINPDLAHAVDLATGVLAEGHSYPLDEATVELIAQVVILRDSNIQYGFDDYLRNSALQILVDGNHSARFSERDARSLVDLLLPTDISSARKVKIDHFLNSLNILSLSIVEYEAVDNLLQRRKALGRQTLNPSLIRAYEYRLELAGFLQREAIQTVAAVFGNNKIK